jgi:hypothetical protein
MFIELDLGERYMYLGIYVGARSLVVSVCEESALTGKIVCRGSGVLAYGRGVRREPSRDTRGDPAVFAGATSAACDTKVMRDHDDVYRVYREKTIFAMRIMRCCLSFCSSL